MAAGGIAAGVLDILYAFIVSGIAGVSPLLVSQFIASGLLGAPAFQGGVATALLGLLLHFAMTIGMAALFVAASRKLPMLTERPILCGIAYGLMTYVIMNHVVLPLSAAPGPANSGSIPQLLGSLAIHAFGVGLPIALAARRFASPRTAFPNE